MSHPGGNCGICQRYASSAEIGICAGCEWLHDAIQDFDALKLILIGLTMATMQNKPCARYGKENCEQNLDPMPCAPCCDNAVLAEAIDESVKAISKLLATCAELDFDFANARLEAQYRLTERFPMKKAA